MPLDREGTLRKAEKLLRQGKLDLAIAEYRAIVDDQPTDWNAGNALGDLYVRAGQTDKAIAEFGRIAGHLAHQGFLPKAAALYKKILKIRPDEELAIGELGGIAASQGLMAEARSHFLQLVQRRRARGDRRGEAEARIRLGDLPGADVEARVMAARARAELGDTIAAVERLKVAAAELQEKGKDDDALLLLTEATRLMPEDGGLRQSLLQAHVGRGDFDSASQLATTAGELGGLAQELIAQGRRAEAINFLRKAAEAHPSDASVRAQLAKALLAQGEGAAARALVTSEVAGIDPDLLWTLAEMELRAGRVADGAKLLEQMVEADGSRRDALVTLGCSIAEANEDAGYECIEVAVRASVAADEWESAAAALNEFVNRVPNHIPALMRLVEICVDGRLEATMYSAQAQLADAYLASGSGLEARVIAEDLVAREPWDRANVERFRRALTLLGEADVDAVIADRLSGQSPFTSTDFMWPADPGVIELPVGPVTSGGPQATPSITPPDPHAIDIQGILATRSQPPAPRSRESEEFHEVDLSEVLYHIPKDDPVTPMAPGASASVETVLNGMRDQVAHDSSPETAEQHFKLAATYTQMGMKDDALKALQVAARSLRHRFRAGAMLAKAYRDAGDQVRAIEWYERAVEAPAPSPEAHHALLYDLALTLEGQGEGARALAVFLELQAQAGDYRDVITRLGQLKVQMGG